MVSVVGLSRDQALSESILTGNEFKPLHDSVGVASVIKGVAYVGVVSTNGRGLWI